MKTLLDPRLTWWLWRDTQNRLTQWGHALLQGRSYSIRLAADGSTHTDALNHIIQINPQMFPKLDAEKQFRLTQGLLVHEVGHALFSDSWPDQEDDLVCEMTNILEDGRIEKAVSVYYPGIHMVIEQLGARMLKDIPQKLCNGLSDEMQVYVCCLIWRWACGRIDDTKMLERLHVSEKAHILWKNTRPQVEEAWRALNTRRVIEIAQQILDQLDLKKDHLPIRILDMTLDVPQERKDSAQAFPSTPAQIQPGVGISRLEEVAGEQDHYSQPRPYIDLENRAIALARQLSDSLKHPAPDTRLLPHEYAGRFNLRQELRTPDTPNLARRGVDISARSLALYLLVDRSGSMCEVDSDVQLALMTLYLAATDLTIPIGIAFFGSADHFESTDRVFEVTPITPTPYDEVKALIAGFEGTTGAEFLNWALDLAGKRLAQRTERNRVLIVIHDGKPVYKGEDGNDWELSCKQVLSMERNLISTIGVYLGNNPEDLDQLKLLFPRLVQATGNTLPEKLGALLRALAY